MITIPTEDECLRRIADFLSEHEGQYQANELRCIKNTVSHVANAETPLEIAEILREIYVATGIWPSEYNPYQSFVDIIEKSGGIADRNIAEIRKYGRIPILANLIASKQTTGTGTITVYNSQVFTASPKLTFSNHYFQCGDNLEGKLIIGFMPGIDAYSIIHTAIQTGKDFAVVAGGTDEPYLSPDECTTYDSSLSNFHLPESMGELMVEYLPQDKQHQHPVVYNKRRTKN